MSAHVRENLANSAIDFIERSTAELADSPRHSLVDLVKGLELPLKARLAHAHRSLVDAKPGTHTLQDIQRGSFESVAFTESLKRREAVAGLRLRRSDADLLT